MSGTAAITQLTKDQADAVLQAVQSSMSMILTSSSRINPGQTISATLIPTSPQIDASELANGIIDVAFTAKNVLFKSTQALPVPKPTTGDFGGDVLAGQEVTSDVLGGQPFPAPVGTVNTLPNPTTTNIPGDLGQVFGTVAVPRLKVKIDIHWRVSKQVDPHDPSQGAQPLAEGHDFVAFNGLSSPTISFAVPPTFTELRVDTLANPQPDRVCLSADVTLTVAYVDDKMKTQQESLTFPLGPIEILLLPILIPTIVAMFSEPNFGVTNTGTVLVVVPEHSPLSSTRALIDYLRKVEAALDAIRGTAAVATWLLGISELLNAIPDQPRVRFKATDIIRRFSEIEVKPGVLFGIGSTNFDDTAQSLMAFGVAGTKVYFYNDNYLRIPPATNQGYYAFTLDVGLPFVAIRDMSDGDAKHHPPVTMPPNVITDFAPDQSDSDSDWEESLSSFRFEFLGGEPQPVEDPPLGNCGSLGPPPPPIGSPPSHQRTRKPTRPSKRSTRSKR